MARAQPARAPRPEWSHGVHLYADDADLVSSLTAYLAHGWSGGGVGLVIATPEHREGLHRELTRQGLDEALGGGRLMELDAADTLRLFVRDGMPDDALFEETVGSLVREVAGEGTVHAFGEMVDVLWARGDVMGALKLESLWSDLQGRESFSLLCGYAEAHIDDGGRSAITRAHDHVAS